MPYVDKNNKIVYGNPLVQLDPVTEFENRIAEFFGAPYAVAVDSCTHGIELCLRYSRQFPHIEMQLPRRTYISIPMLSMKLGIKLKWRDDFDKWKEYYWIADNIYDAAILWRRDSYIPYSLMSISFQHQKHLSLGRGGMILCDNKEAAIQLKKMSYDGRLPNIPWREQDIDTMGYHYYMTPETAQLGLNKLQQAIDMPPRIWTVEDWPDVSQMKIFKNGTN